MTRRLQFAALAIAGIVLASISACGGGGGGDGGGPPPPPPPPTLSISVATLAAGVVGTPYNQTIAASGGTGARTFSISTGALPAGLVLASTTGVIAGIPAGPSGTTDFTVAVVDSGTPQQNATQALSIAINAAAQGRNDSPATATAIGNGTFSASISPSGHPNTIFDPDEDYYAITTTATSTVTVDINANINGSPLDSVIEIVNVNGVQLNTCTAPLFNSPCAHDDDNTQGGLLDSRLEIQVGGATTFYVHVVDFRGDARPDLLYDIVISGVN